MQSNNIRINGGNWSIGTEATVTAPSEVIKAVESNIPVKIAARVYTQKADSSKSNDQYLGFL